MAVLGLSSQPTVVRGIAPRHVTSIDLIRITGTFPANEKGNVSWF
jgi:hypothetical protein